GAGTTGSQTCAPAIATAPRPPTSRRAARRGDLQENRAGTPGLGEHHRHPARRTHLPGALDGGRPSDRTAADGPAPAGPRADRDDAARAAAPRPAAEVPALIRAPGQHGAEPCSDSPTACAPSQLPAGEALRKRITLRVRDTHEITCAVATPDRWAVA